MTTHRASEDITSCSSSVFSGVTCIPDSPDIAKARLSPVVEECHAPEADCDIPSKYALFEGSGPLSVTSLPRLDDTFAFTQAHHGPAYLVHYLLDLRIIKRYKQVVSAMHAKSSSEELEDLLIEVVCKKHRFIQDHKAVLGSNTPTKSIAHQYRTHVAAKVDVEHARCFPDDPEEYVMMGPMSKFDMVVGDIAENSFGEGMCKPILKQTILGESSKNLIYPSWVFRLTSRTLITFCLAAMFCAPVIIQVSGVVSRAGATAAFGVVVTVGCFIMNLMFSDIKTSMMLTVGLAALLSNCLRSD